MSTQSALIQKFASGDEGAFKELYFLFYPSLMRYGKSLGVDHALVQDAVQDLFVWLWEHPFRLAQAKSADQYLYRSLRNNLVSSQKRTRRQDELLHTEVLPRDARSVPNEVVRQQELKEKEDRLSWIMDRLPAKQKEVIYLRYYEDRCFDDISDLMGVSPQVARNYAARALKKLRKHSADLERLLYLSLAIFNMATLF